MLENLRNQLVPAVRLSIQQAPGCCCRRPSPSFGRGLHTCRTTTCDPPIAMYSSTKDEIVTQDDNMEVMLNSIEITATASLAFWM